MALTHFHPSGVRHFLGNIMAKAEVQVEYLGNFVAKKTFRTFIYSRTDNQPRLVESWGEYIKAMGSGLWKDTCEEAPKEEAKPSRGRPRKGN